MGRTPIAGATFKMRYRITTKGTGLTWAEAAIATGAVVLAGNPTLVVKGWADVSSAISAAAQITTTIGTSDGTSIPADTDVWLLLGMSGSGAGVARAATIADDLQIGYQASATMRPSLNVGAGVVFTLEGAAVLPFLIAIGY